MLISRPRSPPSYHPCKLFFEVFQAKKLFKIHKFSRCAHLLHEGVRYPCLQCDYAATKASDLKRHVENKHAGGLVSLSSL